MVEHGSGEVVKVLICGGREYNHEDKMNSVLDELLSKYPHMKIINGGARGADGLATIWARTRDVPCQQYFAEWKKYGKGAGPIRNQEMLDMEKPDLVIAFPGGHGTADMMRRARAAKVPVTEIV